MAEERASCATSGIPYYPDSRNQQQIDTRRWISKRYAERVRLMTSQIGIPMHDLKLFAFDNGVREREGVGRYFSYSSIISYWIGAMERHFAIFD